MATLTHPSKSGKIRQNPANSGCAHLGLGAKEKPINRKHINIFLTALAGTIVPGRTPTHPGTNGTKWRFYCGIQQKKAGLSQGRVPICPGRGPVCLRDGSCLSRTPFHPKCLCLLVFFLPDRLCADPISYKKWSEHILKFWDPCYVIVCPKSSPKARANFPTIKRMQRDRRISSGEREGTNV